MKFFLKLTILISAIISLIIITIIACSIISKNNNFKFTTIQNIQNYANSYPENIVSDNQDWEDPMFVSFYKKAFRLSFFEKILEATCLFKKQKFDPVALKKLLEKVTNSRINKKNKNISDLKLELKTGDKIIIFGDLQAALHSMTRNLVELKNLGYIDDNLKIINQNLYIIIIGDAINKNPYSLETLNIILLLMEKNPEKVIYNKGKHETNGYWESYQMLDELNIKAEILSQNVSIKTPLKDEINNLFDTLADTIIVANKDTDITKNKDTIIITHSKCKPELIDQNTKLIIFGEKKFDVLKESSGLEFIGYDQGAATWSTLSCPTITYQKFFNFYKDAFAELTIGETVKTSKLALYNHDVREKTKNPEYKKTTYNPIFGYIIENNQDNILSRNIFNIGSTMALTGITGPLGHENKIGLETAIYFNNLNHKNNLLKPVIFNDDNTPKIALSNVKKMIKYYNASTLVIPTGNITLLLYLDMVKSGKISVLFPCDGGEQFRKQETNSLPIKNIINFRPSSAQEVKSLINYIVKEHGVKNFAFFYQDDSYGKPIVEQAHEELKKLGITEWLDLPHLRSESDFEYTIKEIRKKMPEAIGCFSSQFPTQEFINQLGGEFFSGRLLFGPSFLYSQALEKFLKTRGINSIFSSVVPDPFDSQIEIIKEFRYNMNIQGHNINCNTLEGYIAGALISDAINKIQKPFTKEKIINYFENMKNYNFKGLNLTFNPEARDLSQPVFIRKLNNKLIKY
ncbi:MAG: Extracellular ligand-binding receptor [candidate division TM6 bacterium GW2011_GWF2_30_66]|nr:MAG: Extracellular ligand-binding receptor [candidate division TM6 bacterium GW2011_GWF2_30_66]